MLAKVNENPVSNEKNEIFSVSVYGNIYPGIKNIIKEETIANKTIRSTNNIRFPILNLFK
ncbi:MAG: hypothetical protein ACI4UE_05835 [Candidatus Scatovivens sp.]